MCPIATQGYGSSQECYNDYGGVHLLPVHPPESAPLIIAIFHQLYMIAKVLFFAWQHNKDTFTITKIQKFRIPNFSSSFSMSLVAVANWSISFSLSNKVAQVFGFTP